MFRFEKFKPEHSREILLDPVNRHLVNWDKNDWAEKMADLEESYSFFWKNDLVLCAGIIPIWYGRGYLWVLLSSKVKKYPMVYRFCRKVLRQMPYRRIEMDSPVGSIRFDRRAWFFGFKLETARARAYLPNGEDASIFVWVR